MGTELGYSDKFAKVEGSAPFWLYINPNFTPQNQPWVFSFIFMMLAPFLFPTLCYAYIKWKPWIRVEGRFSSRPVISYILGWLPWSCPSSPHRPVNLYFRANILQQFLEYLLGICL